MSFVKNSYQQMSFDDPYFNLTKREQKMLDRSWATQFADHIFPLIDEESFRCCTAIRHHVQIHP